MISNDRKPHMWFMAYEQGVASCAASEDDPSETYVDFATRVDESLNMLRYEDYHFRSIQTTLTPDGRAVVWVVLELVEGDLQ